MGRRGRFDARLTLFCLAAVACEDPPTADRPLVRDSAGVRIVENRAPAWGEDEGLQVSAEPTVVIGTVDGPAEQQLDRVRDATVLSDGRIALLNSGAARWQIHAADGSHLRTMGTRGEGPGEFQMLEWIAMRGDTILIFDGWQGVGRLSLYDLGGDLLGTERIEVDGLDFPSPDVVLSDGRFLDERGNGHSSSVAGYDISGSHALSVGLPGHRRPLTEEDRERWIEATLSTSFFVDRPDAARRLRRMYSGSPLPDSTPVHAELEVDDAGRLWVQRYVPPWEDTNDWWVFGPEGAWLGTLSLPQGLEVFEIGADYVLGMTRDELDIEYVVKYALEEPSP